MPLTDTQIRNIKPAEKPIKLYDEKGLLLLVQPSGAKWWRFKYRIAGKEKLLAIGVYPDISLKAARTLRDQAKLLLAEGKDPNIERKVGRLTQLQNSANSFQSVADEWVEKMTPTWKTSNLEKLKSVLKRDIHPWIGNRPMVEITPPELLAVLRRIESRGRLESAHRARSLCGQVFRYAVATGRAERDISADLRGALPPVVTKHHAAITDPKKVGDLLRSIDGYSGGLIVCCALKLSPLVFVRPGELRQAGWDEIDFEAKLWTIPAERKDTDDGRPVTGMKMAVPHIVPLSTQAVAILKELHPLTGHGRFVFPSPRTGERPMSENAVRCALRALGYSNEDMTPHGFRAISPLRKRTGASLICQSIPACCAHTSMG